MYFKKHPNMNKKILIKITTIITKVLLIKMKNKNMQIQ